MRRLTTKQILDTTELRNLLPGILTPHNLYDLHVRSDAVLQKIREIQMNHHPGYHLAQGNELTH